MRLQPRRHFLQTLAATGAGVMAGCLPIDAAGQETGWKLDPSQNLLHPPPDPSQWPQFRRALQQWRQQACARLNYDGAMYQRADFAWVPKAFCCCFLLLNDEFFCDHRRGRFKVEAFLDHGLREFGGYDAVVWWHAYPRIGLDERNQFDFYRDQPGGLAGLRELGRRCRARGVKVFIDYNPWDTGTRREGKPDLEALAELVGSIEADGIFLDTMDRGAAEFRARLDAVRPGVVLEGEGALPLERIHDHHASWAQWFADSPVPGVLRNKWFERRHLLHQIHRWNRDHAHELHTAWMNGTGMLVWENVFGTWVGWNPRDRSMLRAMLPVQRRYARMFCGEAWTPLTPTLQAGLYASLWEGDGLRLWTLVNRSDSPVNGPLLSLAFTEETRYYDLMAGREIRPVARAGELSLCGRISARGLGAVVAGAPAALGKDFHDFLAAQARLQARADWSTAFPARVAVLKQHPSARGHRSPPPGMVEIPAATMTLRVEFRVRECGFYESSSDHFASPGGHPLHQLKSFDRQVSLRRFAVDLTPVTNGQFAQFLQATGYRPRRPENFLKHWRQGAPPPELAEHPVVYVSPEDARAFARWAGKRLPTEEEWQYAAQGNDRRRYPWGNEFKPGLCNAGETGATTAVRAFPGGRSPFGCYDMCGNVWEWTESERTDGRTRFCIIRGGAYYRAKGSAWYMDGGPQSCEFAAKFLLAWPGLDRCATIGFRCAADLSA